MHPPQVHLPTAVLQVMPLGHWLLFVHAKPIAHWLLVEQDAGMHAPAASPKQRGTPVMVLRQQFCPLGQQQFWVDPWPPQTSPGGWQPGGLRQRRRPSASAEPHMKEQQSLLVLQISPSVWQPLSVWHTPDPTPL
jgi:hypothetical protein